ncbi:septation regulator SpoVG [Hominimerdicola sp. 21CYCFAH17_S]
MDITEIKVRRLMTEGKLRGIISITVDGVLAVHDIKVVQGEERLFVAMPSRRDDSGMFRDIVHPITSDARESIEQQILSAYRMEVDRQSAESISEENREIK